MQAASASRCFQPPDKRAGELVPPRGQPEFLKRAADMLADRLQPVEPRHEFQVLGNRQILVERELLGHVADLALDLQRLGPEVVAEHRALALVGRQQAAHDADRRRLARAVGPEKADDLAFGDRPSTHGRRRSWRRSA